MSSLGLSQLLDRIERSNPQISKWVLDREVTQLLGRHRPSPPTARRPPSDAGGHAEARRSKDSAFDWYQRIAAESQPLSHDETARAAAAVEAGLLAEERLESARLQGSSREEITELEILAYEGRMAYELLILSNIRLVFHWCKGITRSIDSDAVQDAFQAGCIGLMRGIQGWDNRMGFTLSTYVSWHIRQAIHRWRTNETSLIRIPVHVWEQLESSEPRMTPETQKAAERAMGVASLDELDVEAVGGAWDGGLEAVVRHADRERLLEAALSVLSDRESMILRLRHGATDLSSEPMTLEEVGQLYGVTRERIRQIEVKAVKKIQDVASGLHRQPHRSTSDTRSKAKSVRVIR